MLRLPVTSGNNIDATAPPLPVVGSATWAIEAPASAYLMEPFDPDNDQIIPAVVAGACPV